MAVNTSTLFTGQHNNVLAPISDFEYGNYRIVTNELGIVTTYSYIDHPYPQGPYWCDVLELVDGSILYMSKFLGAAVAADADFEYNSYRITTNELGVVVSRTLIVHPYPQGPYWSDVLELVDGSILYMSKFLGASVAANIEPYDGSYDWPFELRVVSTDENGVVALQPFCIIILTGGGSYYAPSPLISGVSIVYTDLVLTTVAASLPVSEVSGIFFDPAYPSELKYEMSIDENGVVTVTPI